MTITVEPAGRQRWDDIGIALGARGRRPDACWCQRFRRHDGPDNRAALRREIETSPVPVGLIAYVDAHPAGWTRVVPRHTLRGIRGTTARSGGGSRTIRPHGG